MKKVILIGGASGVAKSTTSKLLSERFDYTHRLGTGFIREMAKAFITEAECPPLYRYSFYEQQGLTAIQNLVAQSIPLQTMIELSVDRALREGTNLIIEGVNIIPGVTEIVNENVLKILLYVKDEEKHFSMINTGTHSKRNVSYEQFTLVRQLQQALLERARALDWVIIETGTELQNGNTISDLLR